MRNNRTTYCRYLFAVLFFFLCGVNSFANVQDDRKTVAQRIAAEITSHQLKKLYVSDFLDPTSGRVDKGCFFSSVFSTLLAERKQNFEVVNRIEGQRMLTKSKFVNLDLQKTESPARVAAATGADVLLMGTFKQNGVSIILELSLREASTGNEIYHSQYDEKSTDAFEAGFPAAFDSTGTTFYFSSLDGIGNPVCVYCPLPQNHDAVPRANVNRTILLSGVFTTKGKLDGLRVVSGSEPALEKAAIEATSRWKVTPAKDAQGNSVPVRAGIETTFNLY